MIALGRQVASGQGDLSCTAQHRARRRIQTSTHIPRPGSRAAAVRSCPDSGRQRAAVPAPAWHRGLAESPEDQAVRHFSGGTTMAQPKITMTDRRAWRRVARVESAAGASRPSSPTPRARSWRTSGPLHCAHARRRSWIPCAHAIELARPPPPRVRDQVGLELTPMACDLIASRPRPHPVGG